ncbi:hypothetical protein WN944_001397 [Citrus x changshan-huyou]|uniref:Uncharacterized protein n=1 Tax=Citrus x changshan-huyou TaxID=2935761 RepID=A0AAP0QMN4_9ROSI
MAAAGAPLSNYDFMMSVLSGIGSDYNPVVVLIIGKSQDLDLSESLSMLMTHEEMLEEQAHAEAMKANLALAANFAQKGLNKKKSFGHFNSKANFNQDGNRFDNPGYMQRGFRTSQQGGNHFRGKRGGRGNNNRGKNWNQGGRPGMPLFPGSSSSQYQPKCQVCFNFGHTAYDCKDRFNRDFVPPQMTYPHQGNNNQRFNQGYNQRNMSAYMATPETLWMRVGTWTAGQPIT